MKNISDIAHNIDWQPMFKILDKAQQLERAGKEVLHFELGEPDFDTPKNIVDVAWNFGPSDEGSITVEEVVKNMKESWDKIDYEIQSNPNQLHEANLLKLDCSKAHILLKWKDVWDSEKTVKRYKSYYEEDKTFLTKQDLISYVNDAKAKNIEWSI